MDKANTTKARRVICLMPFPFPSGDVAGPRRSQMLLPFIVAIESSSRLVLLEPETNLNEISCIVKRKY
jgi:hypothetical protein